MNNYTFHRITDDVEGFKNAILSDKSLELLDIQRILRFVVKIVQILEQVFEDVAVVLIEVKHLSEEDIRPERIRDLLKQIDLLTSRGHFRNAEDVCGRLHFLSGQYKESIEPLLVMNTNVYKWRSVFNLIEEHEGLLIASIEGITWNLHERVENLSVNSLVLVKAYASDKHKEIQNSIDRLKIMLNEILGESGSIGLLELTAEGQINSPHFQLMNQGHLNINDNRLYTDKLGVYAPNSNFKNTTLNQGNNKLASLDVKELALELGKLKFALKNEATVSEDFYSLMEVASAEEAAKKGDIEKALFHLQKAGKWVWEIAQKIGVGIAVATVKKELGL